MYRVATLELKVRLLCVLRSGCSLLVHIYHRSDEGFVGDTYCTQFLEFMPSECGPLFRTFCAPAVKCIGRAKSVKLVGLHVCDVYRGMLVQFKSVIDFVIVTF